MTDKSEQTTHHGITKDKQGIVDALESSRVLVDDLLDLTGDTHNVFLRQIASELLQQASAIRQKLDLLRTIAEG